MNTITERVGGFDRILTMRPAFDKRNVVPSKNFGVHGVEMIFTLRGTRGATYWVFFTNMNLPHVMKEHQRDGYVHTYRGAELGYHSPVRVHEYQEERPCTVLPGGKCFSDCSFVNSDRLVPIFLGEGPDAVWRELHSEYLNQFCMIAGEKSA